MTGKITEIPAGQKASERRYTLSHGRRVETDSYQKALVRAHPGMPRHTFNWDVTTHATYLVRACTTLRVTPGWSG